MHSTRKCLRHHRLGLQSLVAQLARRFGPSPELQRAFHGGTLPSACAQPGQCASPCAPSLVATHSLVAGALPAGASASSRWPGAPSSWSRRGRCGAPARWARWAAPPSPPTKRTSPRCWMSWSRGCRPTAPGEAGCFAPHQMIGALQSHALMTCPPQPHPTPPHPLLTPNPPGMSGGARPSRAPLPAWPSCTPRTTASPTACPRPWRMASPRRGWPPRWPTFCRSTRRCAPCLISLLSW